MKDNEVLYHFAVETGDIKERLARYVRLYPGHSQYLVKLAADLLRIAEQKRVLALPIHPPQEQTELPLRRVTKEDCPKGFRPCSDCDGWGRGPGGERCKCDTLGGRPGMEGFVTLKDREEAGKR